MNDGWDLLCNAEDLTRWMISHGFGPDAFSPPDEWTFPVLIGFCYTGAANPGWLLVDTSAAKRLLRARMAGLVLEEPLQRLDEGT